MPTVAFGDFEWDFDKATSNFDKHGVQFEDAAIALTDPYAVDFADIVEPTHLCTLAASSDGRILHVVSTIASERVRIISARIATRHERRLYEAPD